MALGAEPKIVHIPADFLAERIERAKAALLGDKAEHGVFDNAKIKRFAPEWECKKSFRTTIRESVAWFNEDDSRKIVNAEQDREIDMVIEDYLSGAEVSSS